MEKIVFKNDGEVPVNDILCTTYQMRNMYNQFRDGYISNLEVMNYIQHFSAMKMAKANDVVLDVCCGRGLMTPILRYFKKDIKKYIDPKEHYPFEVEGVVCNVAEMSNHIKNEVNFCIYTSAVEHMHKVHGEQSLKECYKVMKKGAKMFLSCPNTPEDQDGYDTQYKAHVYEWKLSELRTVLNDLGFKIKKEYGLTGNVNDFKQASKNLPKPLKEYFDILVEYLPREFSTAILFIHQPKLAKEVAIICEK